jgi:NADP-dependent 3-hydroxy acid dehydrogenase YdfG
MSVTDLDKIAALPTSLPREFKDVEVLVNNAGLALGLGPAQNLEITDVDTMLNTNVLGLIALTRAFLPGMLERQRGHVINMGSVAGHYAYGLGSGYVASKFAVRTLSPFLLIPRQCFVLLPSRFFHMSPQHQSCMPYACPPARSLGAWIHGIYPP